MRIEIERDPSKSDREALSQGIIEFNQASIPDLEPNEAEIRFHVFARGEEGEIQGGIRASCYWNTLHIELLWIGEALRGLGTGRKLIECAEAFAREQACTRAFVETTSWQAKPFYERCGYTLMATLSDRPKGHASHYLSKSLG